MGFFTVSVYIFVSLLIGVTFVGLSLDFIDLNAAFIYLNGEILGNGYSRFVLGILGLLIILFSLRYLQSLFLRSERDKSISFESSEGQVDITLYAIEDMLRRMLEETQEISHIRPKIFPKRRNLKVVIRSNLASEVNVMEFTRGVQEKVKEKLKSLLGEDREVKVKLIIRKMIFGGRKTDDEEEEPEVPFRNY